MTPTQPITGTLLAAFTRFADLSCYWHRHGTPDSLAVNELQERTRLSVDIPEMIRRLTAFAELGTDQMFDAYASARAEPPKEVACDTVGHIRADYQPNEALGGKESQEPPAGDGWRWMEPGEIIEKGDMVHSSPITPKYEHIIGCPVAEGQFHIYRRRVQSPTP